jgi:hypothetical protein
MMAKGTLYAKFTLFLESIETTVTTAYPTLCRKNIVKSLYTERLTVVAVADEL